MVDTMTDNKVRTVAEVRHAFSKYGGNMGTEGSVAFQFKHCGQMIFAPGTSEDTVMEIALEAGADDVMVDDDGAIEVLTQPAFEAVKNARLALEAAGLKAEVAEVTMRPENPSTSPVTTPRACKNCSMCWKTWTTSKAVYHNAAL
jgi:transcriptional/translational regulatory protein YebC/TACO1